MRLTGQKEKKDGRRTILPLVPTLSSNLHCMGLEPKAPPSTDLEPPWTNIDRRGLEESTPEWGVPRSKKDWLRPFPATLGPSEIARFGPESKLGQERQRLRRTLRKQLLDLIRTSLLQQ
ncbi:hypothetical protein GQ457_03G043430 [Hibiscus cannabinus]